MADMIETGVDRLLNLLKKHKKISTTEAAKLLGVSSTLIEEWTSFLEDEGYVKKEFKLTKTFLVLKDMEEDSLGKKADDINKKREGVVRKAEVAVAGLDQDGEVLNTLKKQFDEIKSDINDELKGMKVDLKQLEKYESLKGDIDNKIAQQEKQFRDRIKSFNDEVAREQDRFDQMLNSIGEEEKKLQKELDEALSLRQNEAALRKKLDEFVNYISQIKKMLKENDNEVVGTQKSLKKLGKYAETLHGEVKEKRDELNSLIKQNKEYEAKVTKMQEDLLNQLKENKTKEKQNEIAQDKFKQFFAKKQEMEKLLEEVTREKDSLEQELVDLIKKAKAFNASADPDTVKKEIDAIETAHDSVEAKRKVYEEKMSKLVNELGGKQEKKKRKWLNF